MLEHNNLVVVKSNRIIDACYKLTLDEKRLLLACIAQIDSLDEKIRSEYRMSASDFSKIFSTDEKSTYKQLATVAERLYERSVIITDREHASGYVKTRWISAITYVKGEGCVQLTFAEKMLPYLCNLKREFTKYKLQYVANMTSVYAIRLYEILIQWKSKSSQLIEIQRFREMLDLGEKYVLYRDLRRRVIEPAKEQINQYTDLEVDYESVKTGRSITHIRFSVKINDQSTKEDKHTHITEEMINASALPGESSKQTFYRLNEKLNSKTSSELTQQKQHTIGNYTNKMPVARADKYIALEEIKKIKASF